MLNRRGGGALRLDGTYRLGESRRRAALRRQLRVQGPASGPHRLIGQSTHKRAALTWHQKECIASRELVRHRRRGPDGACGGERSHRLGCPQTGLGCLQAGHPSRGRFAQPWILDKQPPFWSRDDQVIRENPASRGTETSAEVLVGPPLGAGGWSETPVNSSGTRLTLTLDGGLEGPPRPVMVT